MFRQLNIVSPVGRPIVLSDFMDNIGTGTYPILFGNLKYYRAYDRMQSLEMFRLVERFSPHVALQPWGRFTGDVTVFNSFRCGYTA